MVPPAAIGAMCAAAVTVVGFICFKLAYGIWKKRRDSRGPRGRNGGSAHELPQQIDPEAFEPPPTYAQCVNNPAYMPEDAFKPPEVPGREVTADGVQPSASGGQPPPPSYERILSGEFKELSLAEQRKFGRGESISTEFTVDHIPRELKPNRSRTGSNYGLESCKYGDLKSGESKCALLSFKSGESKCALLLFKSRESKCALLQCKFGESKYAT